MVDNTMVDSNETDDSVDCKRRSDISLQLADNQNLNVIGRFALKEMQASLCTQEEALAIKIEDFED